jgi:hypothetical protein
MFQTIEPRRLWLRGVRKNRAWRYAAAPRIEEPDAE